jgi:hypothetical protein
VKAVGSLTELLLLCCQASVGAEVAPAGALLHVSEGGAGALGVGADADAQPVALAVGLEKLGVGRAVGEIAVDVDVGLREGRGC